MLKVGFIGLGNMGTAMAKALADSNLADVVGFDIDKRKAESLGTDKINVLESAEQVIGQSKYIVLAVKPQYYKDLFVQIKPFIKDDHIIITVAPGFSIDSIKKYLGENVKVVRTMPNTPALVKEGMTAYCFLNTDITDQDHEGIKKILSSFGKYINMKEEDIEAFITIAGSSPAYAYVYVEAMADAAVSFGLPRDVSYELAAQALKGAAQMLLETKEHPAVLKDAVCSPAGGTIQAILKLEETGFRNSIIQSMKAVYKKSIEQRKLSE